ncbi:MAG: uroporphyrinogen decarboxylase [Phaeodactylibacter sp.]|nr:uroporphyrinogen decarboxylase [Phaeodactylibacter sp.]MCB9265342.1 uroporphyrinogen decarboxylase [Lewinellaceae bacterium]MCB9288564.1 uroporphyrinogen decarboxylase [Lewinellaceae bacterium]
MELKNDLLLRTVRGEAVERPPVWLMRQAGRILPQYRAVRERLSGFKELVETPELAAEVTIQPVDALDVDAAILFSDILVIPEAMGLSYEMVEKRGPLFPETIRSETDIERLLSGEEAAGRLGYVYEALEVTRKNLAGRVPLIGFSGAPWTLMAYMVEGSGSKTFSRAKRLLYQEPALAHRLLGKITQTIIAYVKEKARHGANLIQFFDSWAGILSPEQYREFSLPYLREACSAVSEVPVTVFAKGAWFALPDIARLDCQAVGLDWNISPQEGRSRVGAEKILQGNLDPCYLYADPEKVSEATRKMLEAFGSRHIANLGHGVYPDTPLEGVHAFVQTVKGYRYHRQ